MSLADDLFAPSPWKWTRLFAIGLSASVAAFSVFGFVAPFVPGNATWAGAALLAAICGNAQGLANCMAANARRAKAKGEGFEGTFQACVACFLGFGALSAFGLHNGWEAVKAEAGDGHFPPDWVMTALFLFAAFSEPAMNWVVESIKALAGEPEREHERPQAPIVADREPTERPRLAAVGGVSVAVGAALTHSAQAAPPIFPHERSLVEPTPIVSMDASYPSARAHFAALMAEGVTKRVELARRTHVPLSTISRWALSWEAGTFKVEKEAA